MKTIKIMPAEERAAVMHKLKEEGKTYNEIAVIYGISKQRVYQILRKGDKRYFRHISKRSVKHTGLRNWMNTNQISFNELTTRIFGYYHAEHYKRLYWRLSSGCLTMSLIKKILEITGLTFEECFTEEDENVNPNN
jgi:DNA-binding CsgD family transcriptional regulator